MEHVTDALIQIAATVLSALATAAAGYVVQWLRVRYRIDLTRAQEEQLQCAVRAGVDYAEELAHRRMKSGQPLSSEEKLTEARALVERRGLKTDALQIEERIAAELGRRRSTPPPPPKAR